MHQSFDERNNWEDDRYARLFSALYSIWEKEQEECEDEDEGVDGGPDHMFTDFIEFGGKILRLSVN